MADWIQRNQEEAYLGHLEKLLVNRLQSKAHDELVWAPPPTADSCLNQLSLEMNQELDRLEKLIAEELESSPHELEIEAIQ